MTVLERSVSRQHAKPYGVELTPEELEMVIGADGCVTEEGASYTPGGYAYKDPRRIDCA